MAANYLGIGIKYPIEVVNGKPSLSSGEENIKQSINDILTTPLGSKLFNPDYGSRLEELTFEQNDEILISLIEMFIAEAISFWEQRIRLRKVKYTQENDVILCEISYTILSSNEIDSFIYPFYRNLIY